MVFKPDRQRRLEQFAAQLVARQPHRLEHGQEFRRIINDFRPGTFGRPAAQRTVQQPQGGFAMIPAVEAKLIEDAALVRTTGALITAVDLGEILALGG